MAEEKSIDQQLKEAELEMKTLQLEDLKYRVENERARRKQLILAHLAQQRSLDDANEEIKRSQAICKHRKGGKNMAGIVNGHDSNYSVIKHTYPWGEVGVICSRCGKEWRKPELPSKQNMSAEEYRPAMAAYKQAMKDYTEAINLPTDNEPSGSQLFIITKNTAA